MPKLNLNFWESLMGMPNWEEQFSQYTLSELPNKLLATKLGSIDHEPEHIQALVEMFVQMDQTAPAEISGGCTASVVLQYGPKVYFANTGDSRSFLVVYCAKNQSVQVVYIPQEDKPDLADECIYALSATNGMMEFAMPEATTQTVALTQYGKEGQHLLTALEQLICLAAQGWEQSKQGRRGLLLKKNVMLEEEAFQNAKFEA
jgi:hypothetical protein